MPNDVWGALAQSAPAATTLTTIYTVPASRRATVEVVACNRSGVPVAIRLSLAQNGAADALSQYLLYDYVLSENAAQSSAPITMGDSDELRVYVSAADVSFTVNGIEEDA